MTDSTLSDQEARDFAEIGEELGDINKRSLLVVWNELLNDIETVRLEPIPVNVASKIVASWPFLTFQDTAIYHELYHDLLMELREVLRECIQKNPDALDFTGDDDAAENHTLYRDILVDWHILLDQKEAEWRAADPQSHIQMPIIADARAFCFAQTGLAGHLDSIGFTLTDNEFLTAVNEKREVQGE